MDLGNIDWTAMALIVGPAIFGIFGLAYGVVQKMAARPQIDGWDKAFEVMQKVEPYVEKIEAWADKDSQEVPPTPRNPSGKRA